MSGKTLLIGIVGRGIHNDMKTGVNVLLVIPSSSAQLEGIEEGDIITEFCGVEVKDIN